MYEIWSMGHKPFEDCSGQEVTNECGKYSTILPSYLNKITCDYVNCCDVMYM